MTYETTRTFGNAGKIYTPVKIDFNLFFPVWIYKKCIRSKYKRNKIFS